MSYFLGIDGGQSHTTALVADAYGRILGRGHAGASNHTRSPGGPERLLSAIDGSVTEALKNAGLLGTGSSREFQFTSAYLAMTGEPEDKIELVQRILRAERLVVDHDAPGALAGALTLGEGVIVLGGTGSVACGKTADGKTVNIGGHGFLFGDEGGAYTIARDAISDALKNQDRDESCRLTPVLLDHFKRNSLKEIIEDHYAGLIGRDDLAGFAVRVGELADEDDPRSQEIIDHAACALAEMAVVAAVRLDFGDRPIRISYSGGVFDNLRLLTRFAAEVSLWLSNTHLVKPKFPPYVGALFLSYALTGEPLSPSRLAAIGQSYNVL
jgi:N-acetylglucosamine kinase-like BadF-type ATPase